MTIFVGLLCVAFLHISYTYKRNSTRDKKGKVMRDDRKKDLRVSIGGRTAASLVTAAWLAPLGWPQVSGGRVEPSSAPASWLRAHCVPNEMGMKGNSREPRITDQDAELSLPAQAKIVTAICEQDVRS